MARVLVLVAVPATTEKRGALDTGCDEVHGVGRRRMRVPCKEDRHTGLGARADEQVAPGQAGPLGRKDRVVGDQYPPRVRRALLEHGAHDAGLSGRHMARLPPPRRHRVEAHGHQVGQRHHRVQVEVDELLISAAVGEEATGQIEQGEVVIAQDR